jgi:A1 cistron-splicing factor AAR2
MKWVEPKERILMKYDPKTENIDYVGGIITDDRLKGLDKELAAYPFEGLGLWRSLVSRVTEDILDKVMGERKEGRLDGMTSIKGMEEEDVRLNSRGKLDAEGKLVFPVVDAKRSWRDGAIGEEITKYSKDKSWLLGDVVKNEGGESILTGKISTDQ